MRRLWWQAMRTQATSAKKSPSSRPAAAAQQERRPRPRRSLTGQRRENARRRQRRRNGRASACQLAQNPGIVRSLVGNLAGDGTCCLCGEIAMGARLVGVPPW